MIDPVKLCYTWNKYSFKKQIEILLAKPENILNRHSTFYNSNGAKNCACWMDLYLFKQFPSEYSLIIT